jgi:hypothetical protein
VPRSAAVAAPRFSGARYSSCLLASPRARPQVNGYAGHEPYVPDGGTRKRMTGDLLNCESLVGGTADRSHS